MKKAALFALNTARIATLALIAFSQAYVLAWQSDNGDGTYTNPPLYADYPDPDIIRVGDTFYFATTTFVNSPGLRLLKSEDLVNWEIVTHVISRLDGREQYDMQNGTAYRSGVFAPSLRYHEGIFYLVVTPVGQNTRIYFASDPEGTWQYNELDRGAFDPAFFIDDDGTGYIATSGGWDGTVTLLTLNEDFSQVIGSREIFYNAGAEGSKIVKRGEWYYMFHSIPSKLALTCSRAKDLLGPWETIDQINDETGGHQGAIVDLPDGSWYGFVMIDSGAIGRMTNLSPIFWENDWPVWGTPEHPAQVPSVATKPIQGKAYREPQTSDGFSSDSLGQQWLWNHNPDNARWSLTERPGYLRLKPTASTEFWTARNTLTQKAQGPWSRGEAKLELGELQPGDICGLGTLGKINGHIAVNCDENGSLFLSMNVINDGVGSETRVASIQILSDVIYLRVEMDFESSQAHCSYSLDAKSWTTLGGSFDIAFDWRTGTFQGEQFALFCYNPNPGNGFVDIDWFRFSDSPTSDYDNWITRHFPNDAETDMVLPDSDPDQDGKSNAVEFAFDSDPRSSESMAKRVGKISNIDGDSSLLFVLPIRAGAKFFGEDQKSSAEIDGISYQIQGSDDLVNWDLQVTEVLGEEKYAAETDMPDLSEWHWDYRTFRCERKQDSPYASFLRTAVTFHLNGM